MKCKEAENLLVQTTTGLPKGNTGRPRIVFRYIVLAVITGATSGIGWAFAEALAGLGCDLVLTGRRTEKLSQVSADLVSRFGVKVQSVNGDLTALPVENALVQIIRDRQVDYLINNAGSGFSVDFCDADVGQIDGLRELLAGVPGRLMSAALPDMIGAGSGIIINVGSLAGRVSVPGSSIYVASKIYLERLSETLALELHKRGIAVQALIPGYVRTDFHRDIPDYKSKQRSRGAIRWLEADAVVRLSLKAAHRARRRALRRPRALPRPRDVVVIPGVMNRFLNALSRLVPRRLVYFAAANRDRLT